jgi:hypothetical protein
MLASAGMAHAQQTPVADPASLAFEEGRWADAIAEYRIILERSPTDRMSLLRIAQAERELGRYEQALVTLDAARELDSPPAMVDLERARNLVAIGREEEAFAALLDADHNALRAYQLLSESSDFDPLRGDPRFVEVVRNVRARVQPCRNIPETYQFDFWLGRWEVRTPDGTLAGHNTITKAEGGCTIAESWEGAGGGTGRSTSFYLPSRDQWRQVWIGSGGTLIDMTGALIDGEMHMEGTIEYPHLDRVVAFRATWSRAPDGRVRQRMEEFVVADNAWNLWFDGIYRRID